MLAAANHQREAVVALLDAKADVNLCNEDGSTALMAAVLKGDTAIAHLLLDAGADVNHRDQQGDTPLHLAFQHNYPPLWKPS